MKLKEIKLLNIEDRLYKTNKPIIAITGGIASGKSTVCEILKKLNFPIIDADAIIKKIYKQEDTFLFVKKEFPSVIKENTINFSLLRILAFSNKENLYKLENYLYKKMPQLFVEDLLEHTNNFIIYDVPLLFEKKMESKVDLSILVYSSAEKQIERGINRDKAKKVDIQKILDEQISIELKKNLSNYVIDNNNSLEDLKNNIKNFISTYFIQE